MRLPAFRRDWSWPRYIKQRRVNALAVRDAEAVPGRFLALYGFPLPKAVKKTVDEIADRNGWTYDWSRWRSRSGPTR